MRTIGFQKSLWLILTVIYPVVKIRRLDISVLLNRMYRNSCFGGVDSAQKNHQDEACRCNQRLTVNNYRRGKYLFPRAFFRYLTKNILAHCCFFVIYFVF